VRGIDIACPDGGHQPELGGAREVGCLVEIGEGGDGNDGTEDLFAGDDRGGRDIVNDRRQEEESPLQPAVIGRPVPDYCTGFVPA
jgi:hypothetical protein